MEEWRTIEGYEGLYEVSNFGRVKSLKFDKEKVLQQGKNTNGYLYVVLYKEGKVKNFLVHRLVASAFIDNPNNYPCINHKDENPSNNCVDNLEWCDQKYNVNFGTGIQRRVANTDYKTLTIKRVASTDYKAIAEKLSRQVYQYSQDGELVAIWGSTMECGRNGFFQSHVASCCRGERKTHKGFKWSYTPINPK